MTQTNEINHNDLDFQKKQFLLMGGKIKNIQKKLPQAEITKLKKYYRDMYFGLTSINWGHGMTLGMAWQKALEQMDAFVAAKTKNQNHQVGAELAKIHKEFRRNMAKHIMTSEYSEEKLSEQHKQLFISYGEKKFQQAKNPLNEMYKKYTPQQEVTQQPKFVQLDLAKQKTQQIMQQILLQQLNERAA